MAQTEIGENNEVVLLAGDGGSMNSCACQDEPCHGFRVYYLSSILGLAALSRQCYDCDLCPRMCARVRGQFCFLDGSLSFYKPLLIPGRFQGTFRALGVRIPLHLPSIS